jgi:hypothetical protein
MFTFTVPSRSLGMLIHPQIRYAVILQDLRQVLNTLPLGPAGPAESKSEHSLNPQDLRVPKLKTYD